MSLLSADSLLTNVGRFRLVSLLEGLSFLLLLFVAMPLKYGFGMPEAVSLVGRAHGLLFVVFVAALIAATREAGWGLGKAALFFVLSTVPFGFLLIDRQAKAAAPLAGASGATEPAG